MKLLRVGLLAAAALATTYLIASPLAGPNLGRDVRYREVTLGIELVLVLFVLARKRPGAWLAERLPGVEGVLASPRGFAAAMGVMLALFLLSALTQHWAFRTGSHDFSMIDEALHESLRGRFLHSPVLGRSFLSEHFSPVLALLVPVHALVPDPYLLVLVQPLALWAAGLVLRDLLVGEGLGRATAHLASLIWLNHAIVVSTLNYLFHMECFLPAAVFALYRSYQRGAGPGYWLWMIVALAIKEDVGLYLAGLGAFIAIAGRRPILGSITILASLAWVAGAVYWAMPTFSGDVDYRFASRWAAWGLDLPGIVLGYATQPVEFLRAVLAWPYLSFLASLLLLPLASPWGWLLVAAPWIVQSTSDLSAQSGLLLYYGMPLLAFGTVASAIGLRTWIGSKRGPGGGLAHGLGERLARPPWIAAMVGLAIVLNVSHLNFPAIPRERPEVVRAIRALPEGQDTQLMWCFFPVAGYERPKRLLRPGDPLTAPLVVLRTDEGTWPFSPAQVESTLRTALDTGSYEARFTAGPFHILERRSPISNPGVVGASTRGK